MDILIFILCIVLARVCFQVGWAFLKEGLAAIGIELPSGRKKEKENL